MDTSIRRCSNCQCYGDYPANSQCGHSYCPECLQELEITDVQEQCPICDGDDDGAAAADPANILAKLESDHGLMAGTIVWYYTGRDHNWLYNKHTIDIINEKYQANTAAIELEIPIGDGQVDTYIIDFNHMVQYPKMYGPKRSRTINYFRLLTADDLNHHSIVGVAGVLV